MTKYEKQQIHEQRIHVFVAAHNDNDALSLWPVPQNMICLAASSVLMSQRPRGETVPLGFQTPREQNGLPAVDE